MVRSFRLAGRMRRGTSPPRQRRYVERFSQSQFPPGPSIRATQLWEIRRDSVQKKQNPMQSSHSKRKEQASSRPIKQFGGMHNRDFRPLIDLRDAAEITARDELGFRLFDVIYLPRTEAVRDLRLQYVKDFRLATANVPLRNILHHESHRLKKVFGLFPDLLPVLH